MFRIVACSAVLGLGLLTATNAMATGTTTSAGDQQYVDPLTTTAPSHASTAPASSPSPPSASSSGAPQPSPAAAPAATPTPSAPQASTSTLPYTGLNLGACVAVGAGLLGAGLLLRRVMRRA